jgi:hypothetical protein
MIRAYELQAKMVYEADFDPTRILFCDSIVDLHDIITMRYRWLIHEFAEYYDDEIYEIDFDREEQFDYSPKHCLIEEEPELW